MNQLVKKNASDYSSVVLGFKVAIQMHSDGDHEMRWYEKVPTGHLAPNKPSLNASLCAQWAAVMERLRVLSCG